MNKNLHLGKVLPVILSLIFQLEALSQEWTWIKGLNTHNTFGIYGVIGVPAAASQPGSREAAGSWTDDSGNLWLFGGNGYASATTGRLNDLWKFDPVTHMWTWVSGSLLTNQWGVYGTLGTPSITNIPGARVHPVTWKDNSGNLWLFGGRGYDALGNENNLNDLWMYNVGSNQWTWMGGGSTVNQHGIYGTVGVASATNIPGARHRHTGWTDNSGNFWLFGGHGYAASGGESSLNDLWKYDPTANTWVWLKGALTGNEMGVYGTTGVPNILNVPGARNGAKGWKDNAGNLWLFSGDGNASAASGLLNDIWKYDIATNQWVWMKGADAVNETSVFGTQSIPSPAVRPGGRFLCASWSDNNNNFFIQGGYGISLSAPQHLNDTWKYNSVTGEWTFVRGAAGQVAGVYGTQSVTAVNSDPGLGNSRISWRDNNGNFWLFGGTGYDVNSNLGVLNELWNMNPCLPQAPVNISLHLGQNICTGTSATLSAVSHTNTVSWYATSSSTTALFTGTTYVTPPLTSATLSTETYTYYAASTNTCGTSAVRTPVIVTSANIYPVVSAGQVFTVAINIPNGSTPNSSWDPWVHNFIDPVPVGGVVIGFDLTCELVDQGWGGSGAAADIHVADQRIGLPILTHLPVFHTLSTTEPFRNYVYGGTNTFKMYFAGWSGWQGFINNGYLVIRYQMKPSAPITICQNSEFKLTAYGATTYSWTGGVENDVTFIPVSSQAYTVTGYNNYGCSNTATQQLNVTPAPTLSIPSSTSICRGQSMVYTATLTGPSHTFSWNTGSTDLSLAITPTIGVRYTAVAMNTLTGCSHSLETKIHVNPVPVFSVTASSNSFCAGPTTTLSLADNGKSYGLNFDGVDDYIETGKSLTELGPADFSIEAWIKTTAINQGIVVCTNANTLWEVGEKAFYINSSGMPAFVGNSHNYIMGNMAVNDGNWHHVAVVFNHTGGSSGIGKIYVDGSDQTASSGYSPSFNNLGTFKIGAPNYNNFDPEAPNFFAGAIDDVRIWNTARTQTHISANMNTCLTGNEPGLIAYYTFEDGTGSAMVSDRSKHDNNATLMNMDNNVAWVEGRSNCFTGYTSYLWQPLALTSSSVLVTPLSTAVYSLTVVDALSCTASVTETITVYPLPTVAVNSGAICTGDSYTIIPSGADSYTFVNGASVVTPTASTSYSIVGQSSLGCTSANPGVSAVVVNPLPVLSITGPNAVCMGSVVSQTVSGATSYSWSTGSTNTIISISPFVATPYHVTGTITATGCFSSASKTITVGQLPVITVNSGNVCAGNAFTMMPGGAATYTFSNGTNTVSSVVSPTSNTSYFVSGSSTLGCISSGSAIANVIVNAAPVIVVNSGAVCAGGVYTITPSGASTYTFSNGTATVNPLVNSSYSVSGTNVLGCVSSVPAIAHVTVNPVPVISVSDATLCSGTGFSLNPSGASTYTFVSPSGPVSSWVSPLVNTSYSVTGTSAEGCVSANPAIMNVSVVALPVIAVNSGTVCSGSIYTLMPSGAVSYTYSSGSSTVAPMVTTSYSVSGTNSSGCVSSSFAVANVTVLASPVVSVNSGAICKGDVFTMVPSGASTYTFSSLSASVSPVSNTSYTVSGTSSLGCISLNQAVANVVVNPVPALSIVGDQEICRGKSSLLNATGALSYTWSTNTTGSSETISPLTSTTYTVLGTGSGSCIGTATIYVVVNQPPVITLNTGSVCPFSTFTIIPAGAVNYSFSGGSPIVSPLVTTSYSVFGVDANGCMNDIPAVTTVTVINDIAVSVNGNTSLCTGESTTLTASGANTYFWSTGLLENTIVLTPSATSVYTLIGADGTCSDTTFVTVEVNPFPNVIVASSSSIMCVGESVTLTASGASTYLWSNGASTPEIVINPVTSVTYSVRGIDENGCPGNFILIQHVDECLGMNFNTNQHSASEIKLYPNPNSGEFIIETWQETEITLVNPLGQIIMVKQIRQGKNEMKIEEQQKGLYFVYFKTGETTKTIKVVKH